MLLQHLRQEPVLKRHAAVVARIPGGQFVDCRRRVGVVVAAGNDARARGRAQRRRMHVRVEQAASGEAVKIGRADRAAITAELPESRPARTPSAPSTHPPSRRPAARPVRGSSQSAATAQFDHPLRVKVRAGRCAAAGRLRGRCCRRVRLNVQVRRAGIPGLAAPAGCYLVAPVLAAVPFPAPSSGFMASSRLSANFRWEMSSCSAKA